MASLRLKFKPKPTLIANPSKNGSSMEKDSDANPLPESNKKSSSESNLDENKTSDINNSAEFKLNNSKSEAKTNCKIQDEKSCSDTNKSEDTNVSVNTEETTKEVENNPNLAVSISSGTDTNEPVPDIKGSDETFIKPNDPSGGGISNINEKQNNNVKNNRLSVLGRRKFKPTINNVQKKVTVNTESADETHLPLKKCRTEIEPDNIAGANHDLENDLRIVNIRHISTAEIRGMKREFDNLSKIHRDKYKNLNKNILEMSLKNDDLITTKCDPKEIKGTAHVIKVHLNCWPKEWTGIPDDINDKNISEKDFELPENTSVILLKSVSETESLKPPVGDESDVQVSSENNESCNSTSDTICNQEKRDSEDNAKNIANDKLLEPDMKSAKPELKTTIDEVETGDNDKKFEPEKRRKIKLPNILENPFNSKKRYKLKPIRTESIPIDSTELERSKSVLGKSILKSNMKKQNAEKIGEASSSTADKSRPRHISSYYGKTCYEMRKNYLNKFGKSGPTDVAKLRMRDLIFYNPTTNPMTKESDEKILNGTETKSDRNNVDHEEDVDDVAVVPQLKVGPDGQIIIDPKSLPTKPKEVKKIEEIHETPNDKVTGKYNKTSAAESRKSWSYDDTIKFYKALHTIGADFSMMATLFPDRSRKNLKYKFKREEKVNSYLVDKVLSNPANFNFKALERELEKDQKKIENAKQQKLKNKTLETMEKKKTTRTKKNHTYSIFEPKISAKKRRSIVSTQIPYEALNEDSMSLLHACSKVVLGPARYEKILSEMETPPKTYKARQERDQNHKEDKPEIIEEENWLGKPPNVDCNEQIKNSTSNSHIEEGKLMRNIKKDNQGLKDCSITSDVEKTNNRIYDITESSGDSDDVAFLDTKINHKIEKQTKKVRTSRRSKTFRTMNQTHVRNLQSIVADGIIEDDIEYMDVSPPSKKDQIIINTNIVYDSMNIRRCVSYDTKNLNTPVDVNITIDHQPSSNSNSVD